MRLGKIVVYQGREFRAGTADSHSIDVISDDPADIPYGFRTLEPGVYIKTVDRAAVDAAFYRSCKAVYRGHTFSVISDDDGRLELFSVSALPELGFRMTGDREWTKIVGRDECERVWEERRSF